MIPPTVIPAKAGIQLLLLPHCKGDTGWIGQKFVCQKRPTFAGMTSTNHAS
jgi:hypothetical protein